MGGWLRQASWYEQMVEKGLSPYGSQEGEGSERERDMGLPAPQCLSCDTGWNSTSSTD